MPHYDVLVYLTTSAVSDAPSCVCTPIDWYPGMDLTKKAASFFCWFCSQEDASTDDIAEV